jgi:hypothetical protein
MASGFVELGLLIGMFDNPYFRAAAPDRDKKYDNYTICRDRASFAISDYAVRKMVETTARDRQLPLFAK